jgi:hypothetical protein
MSNNLGIYLRYIIGIINYLGITLSEPIISHLYINILSHNWYYQLLRHRPFPTLLGLSFTSVTQMVLSSS